MLAEHAAKRVGDLAKRRARQDRRDNRGHQIRSVPGRVLDPGHRRLPGRRVPGPAQLPHRVRLTALALRVDPEQRDPVRLVGLISIDADDDPLTALDRLLIAVGRFLDLPLDTARLDGRQGPARPVDFVNQRPGVALDLVGPALDFPGSARRIGGVGDARFGGDDLLGAEGDARRFLGRQRQGFVAAVAVE